MLQYLETHTKLKMGVGTSGNECNEVTSAVSIKTRGESWLLPGVPSGFNGGMSLDPSSHFLTAV
jgi:hypothetical protein